MADIPLNHLSRPQLVHLLLRIVDLLSLPSMPAPSVPLSGNQTRCPSVVPYDASIDPWNAPDEGQSDSMVTRDPGALVGTGSSNSAQSCGISVLPNGVGTACLPYLIRLLWQSPGPTTLRG